MTVAVDTSFLLQLADGHDEAWEVYAAILSRSRPWLAIVTLTVTDTLDFYLEHGDKKFPGVARRASQGLHDWHIKEVVLDESQRKVASILTYHFMHYGVLDTYQRLEAEILGEVSLVADVFLISTDSPIAQFDSRRVTLESRLLGLSGICIATPGLLLEVLNR